MATNKIELGCAEIQYAGNKAYLDFAVTTNSGYIIAASFFKREAEVVKALGANLALKNPANLLKEDGVRYERVVPFYGDSTEYHVYNSTLGDNDTFTHSVVTINADASNFIVCREGEEAKAFYNFLMQNFELPLLPEWGAALMAEFQRKNYLTLDGRRDGAVVIYAPDWGAVETPIKIGNTTVSLKELKVFRFIGTAEAYKEELKKIVSSLLKDGTITFPTGGRPQKHLEYSSMDEYMKDHGGDLVENLSKEIRPLTELSGDATTFTAVRRPLYAQQIAMVNGVTAMLNGIGNKRERKKTASRYAILNEGMGCGKTLQAAMICESIAVEKAVKQGHDLKEIYDLESDLVNYRAIIMCPGHLTHKWAREIESDVPYARVEVLEDLSQLVRLRERGKARSGREYYVISKDFAKLDAQEEPAVSPRQKNGVVMSRTCRKCGTKDIATKTCPKCGGEKFDLKPTREKISGLVCPGCGNILIPYTKITSTGTVGLKPIDFAAKKETNTRCMYCGSQLWQPRVKHLTLPGDEPRESPWVRGTIWANEAKKNKKTLWLPRKSAEKLKEKELLLNVVDVKGCRKTAPAGYIKRHLKGFFDVAIFDEVHTLKSGNSAQGLAMHALCKASKKQIALTGTIAGGCADHLFYLLYRLDPRRMKERGYSWEGRVKFIEKYGSLETVYEAEAQYNKMSKGRQVGSPSCKPGISPRIFTDFLLDRAVFLDVTDMSRHLPPLKEKVVLCDLEDDVQFSYSKSLKDLQAYGKSHGCEMRLMATQLQFGLSYPDKPYGRVPILNPEDGAVAMIPRNFDEYSSGKLLPKEEKLIDLLNDELAEGRNCFVYAEYTGTEETRISERLAELIKEGCELRDNEVAILDSKKVEAVEREEWIARVATAGARVIITNPKCVETGLDFCFMADGKLYNFPTIFFFQMGYSLFTIWQASRRHYRLNQRSECRTFYMGYRGTPQEAVIGLVAKKMSATSAIQGKFSSEGLSAMAQGVDARVALAQAMSNMDFSTSNDLQDMFDVVQAETDDRLKDAPRMRLLGDIVPSLSVAVNTKAPVDDEFDELFGEAEETPATSKAVEDDDFWAFLDICFEEPKAQGGTNNESEHSQNAEPTPKRRRKGLVIRNQYSFF